MKYITRTIDGVAIDYTGYFRARRLFRRIVLYVTVGFVLFIVVGSVVLNMKFQRWADEQIRLTDAQIRALNSK